jgi:integrase
MTEDLPITLQRCVVSCTSKLDPGRKISVVPKTHDGVLNEKQLVDYRDQRARFLSWLLNVGKSPTKGEGYSAYTVYSTSYRTARFDKWVWQQRGEYHYPPDEADAQDFFEYLAFSDKGRVEKGKLQEAIQHLSKWLHHEHGQPEWEFTYNFDGSGGNLEPRDFLSNDERRAIRQTALNYGGIPAYDALSASERSGWRHYVSNVLGKPYDEVTRADWDAVNGWEITSLVHTSLDAGLRPDEVRKATPDWVDAPNKVLRIPREDSSKNEGNWTVSLTDRTAVALERWLTEREMYDRYDDTENLWLTSHGNPWSSKSLARLLRRLCDQADIEYENRQMSWYTIRHSVGTYMTSERDLAATKAQLRHKSPMTTMKYDQVPVEERRDALERMG